MEIELVNIGDINPSRYNPRTITKEALEGLKNSILTFGQVDPLIVNKRSDTLVGGHQRLNALISLGINKAHVVYVNLDDREEKALNIALNSKHISGEFEAERLEVLLKELKIDFEEYEPLRFELLELDFDLDLEDDEEKDLGDEDKIPKEPEEVLIKEGDLIEIGGHRVLCGDSTNLVHVAVLMQKEKADIVFTDPPYGVSYKSGHSDKFEVLKNDDVFLDFKQSIIDNSKEECPIFIWTSHHVFSEWREMYKDIYCSSVIWSKGGGGMGDLESDYATDYEIGIYCRKGRPKFANGRKTAVWEIKKDAGSNYLHPTQKPVELCENAISHFFNNKIILMDLFLGSGSSLIACEKTNNKCYGTEIEPKFCQVIIQRWCDYTKQDSVRINGELVSWKQFTRKDN